MTLRPKLFHAEEGETPRGALARPAPVLGLFGAGLYGGFVQAGVGFVLLAVLGGLLRYDAVRANALKLVCTLLFGVAALGVFVLEGQLEWAPAVVLAVATVIGSQLGVRFAIKTRPAVLRGIIFVAVLASCIAAFMKSQGLFG